MQNNNNGGKFSVFFKKNWGKVLLLLFLVYIGLRKDLSFNIRLNTPLHVQENARQEQPATPKLKGDPLTEVVTEKRAAEDHTAVSSGLFSWPSIGGRSEFNPAAALESVPESEKASFLKRFAHVAISEHRKFGIPASIILANAMLHSAGGTAGYTGQGNNYFALTCTEGWEGTTGTWEGKCYRRYDNAWASFRDHSQYLSTGGVAGLNRLDPNDYRAWARAMEAGAYSRQANLASHLVQLIERYRLFELDQK